ncbi:upstream stimulatory factor-like isoform X2 [Amphiura filiformis]|uniref:upstream stimulatory factor-like isoform X2 n=1 Tax=Amphiura filiformis TaxID=82378 RepID=UPI003B21B70A
MREDRFVFAPSAAAGIGGVVDIPANLLKSFSMKKRMAFSRRRMSQEKSDSDRDADATVEIHDGDTVITATDEQAATIVGGAGFGDNLQYQFRTDGNGGNQVTYRVVQVNDTQDGDASPGAVNVVTTTNFPQGQQAITQVIQAPFSNGESPTTEGQTGETRFTYFPAAAINSDAASSAVVTTTADGTLSQNTSGVPSGQFYVMMSPQDVLQNATQRTIAPRTHTFSPKIEGTRTARDERRRATHNEVERRRRDKINNWIVKLSKVVPECNMDHSKAGQSKGGILMKTVDYIGELRTANTRMAESLKDMERLSVDSELLRQQVEELKNENMLLRAQLQQAGIDSAAPDRN